MKKLSVILLALIVIMIGLASCSSHKCDAYKSSHYYYKEVIR